MKTKTMNYTTLNESQTKRKVHTQKKKKKILKV